MHIKPNGGKFQVLDENDLVLRTLDTYSAAERWMKDASAHLKK